MDKHNRVLWEKQIGNDLHRQMTACHKEIVWNNFSKYNEKTVQ